MTDKILLKTAFNFLLSFRGITEDDIQRHLQSEQSKPDNLKFIYYRLCESAQNKQMSTKVVGKAIGGIKSLGPILHEFDPHKIVAEYKINDVDRLFETVVRTLKPTGQLRTTKRSIWPQFCKSILDGAYFLNSFSTAKDFYNWADLFANDPRSVAALPLMISIEISGFGFPLACDFLKEIGYSEYGKPDVHLIDIFSALNIIDPLEKSVIKQNYATLKAIDRIAKSNNVTSYAVDKVFWLIGSGNFHLSDKNIGRQKQNFIKQITET